MTNEELCSLALAAIDDVDAHVVLDDALEERDETWETYARRMTWMPGVDLIALYRNRAKVISAVLLFGDWTSTTWSNRLELPWPIAERCRLRRFADAVRHMNQAYEAAIEYEAANPPAWEWRRRRD